MFANLSRVALLWRMNRSLALNQVQIPFTVLSYFTCTICLTGIFSVLLTSHLVVSTEV